MGEGAQAALVGESAEAAMCRRWLWFCAWVIASAWLGCAGETPMGPGMSGPGQAGFASVAPPQAGSGLGAAGAAGGLGAAGTAGAAGMLAPATMPDAATLPPRDAGAMPDAGTAPPPDAGQPVLGQWTMLMEESWELPAGGEVPQHCADKMLAEDIYVSAIRPIHPLGTHHTTLSVTPNVTQCTSAALLGNGIIYAAGVGSEELRLPPGVAMKLPAGQVLHLGLHLYNVGQQPLTGVSGLEIIRVAAEDVEHEAELMLSGPVQLMIEPGTQTITHRCSVTENQTVFAIFPHMHQLGVHLKTTVTSGGQPRVIHDAEYAFEEQFQIAFDPMQLRAGDQITTECTYDNTTGRTVGFGESSDTEMCFSILYRYPATGRSFCGR